MQHLLNIYACIAVIKYIKALSKDRPKFKDKEIMAAHLFSAYISKKKLKGVKPKPGPRRC